MYNCLFNREEKVLKGIKDEKNISTKSKKKKKDTWL